MARLNFICLLLILLTFFCFYFQKSDLKKIKHQELSKGRNQVILLNKKISSIESGKEENVSGSSFPIFNPIENKEDDPIIKQPNIDKISENKSEEKGDASKKKVFKTADEVLSTLFPNLEKQIGKKHRDDFKHGIPSSGILNFILPLTEEQKRKYKELKELKSAEINAIYPHEGPFSLEESFEITRQVRLISEYYGVEIINLLTEKQLIEYKEYAQTRLDEYEKFLKKDGEILYIDTFDEREKLHEQAKKKE